MYPKNSQYFFPRSNSIFSILKVENVVNEPRNPVPTNNEKDALKPNPETIPRKKDPDIFTTNVAKGKEPGFMRFIQFEMITRAKTPNPAPTATISALLTMIIPPLPTQLKDDTQVVTEYASNQPPEKTCKNIRTKDNIFP